MPAPVYLTSLGSAFSNTSSTTLVITTTSAISVGEFVVVRWAADNLSATTPTATCSDGSANVYTVQRQAAANATAAAGIAGGMLTCLATVARASGSTITLTFSGAVVGKAAYAETFINVSSSTRVAAVGSSAVSGTAATSGASAAGIVAGDLVLGFSAVQSRTAATGDADTVNGAWSALVGVNGGATSGQDAGSVQINGQYKIATAAGAQTYDNTVTSTYWITGLVVMQAAPDPAITQASYGLYADGSEAGSVALAAQDTSYTADMGAGDVSLLLRTRLQSTSADPVMRTDDFQLQWEKNANGTWTNVFTDPFLYDQYPSYDWTSSFRHPQAGTGPWRIGQSFTGNGQRLSRISFFIQKGGAPVGTYTAALFAHSGTFGVNSVGTGTALATSTTSLVGTQITNQRWCDFNFDESFTLVNGINYVAAIILTGSAIDAANYIQFVLDQTAPTHPGNYSTYATGAWTSAPGSMDFRVFTKAVTPPTTVVGFASPNVYDESPTTNRLGAGTGSFVAGGTSHMGVVADINGRKTWAANNFTELLYAITLKAANLANGDTLRFRVVYNGATTALTYTQTPTVPIIKTSTPGRPKIYTGTVWVQKPLKVYTGAAWVEKPVKVWTGSVWKTLT